MTDPIGYKPYLNVYVVWYPQFNPEGQDISEGRSLASKIYSSFTRDIDNPLNQGLGIPVHFRNEAPSPNSETSAPPTVDLDRAHRNFILLLVDGNMVLAEKWGNYVRDLSANAGSSEGNNRVLPVSLSKGALQFGDALKNTNFVRYHEFAEEHKIPLLLLWITHELCRFLSQPAKSGALSPKPIRLFISHAKQDGLPLAETFRDAIADTPAATFFDSVDIAPGYDFGVEIEENIRESTLLVLQSDAYSSRPWCRQELLIAKRFHRPIVIVNALDDEERRSFPYMGNVPVIRWTGKNHEKIIGLALREHLRFMFTEQRIGTLQKAGWIPREARVLMRPPEILDFQNLAERSLSQDLVIYPDPPLGAEEDKIISTFGQNISFTTLVMPEDRILLTDKLIGLSISESPDLAVLGFSGMHLRDALIEFTRQLLARDANVAYGGDLRPNGFTQVLFSLVSAHNSSGAPNTYRPIRNYLTWPLHLKIDKDAEAELIRMAKLYREPLPQDLSDDPGIDPSVYLEPDSVSNRYVWARCLTAMRQRMNHDINVRVLMGGKLKGYTGKYPGLLEEAYLALSEEKPLFLIGAFGGCTRAIIELIEGHISESLSWDYQRSDESYNDFVEVYNKHAESNPRLNLEVIDYQRMSNFFRRKGINELRNGLTDDENRYLFSTDDLDQVVYYVLKGLYNLH